MLWPTDPCAAGWRQGRQPAWLGLLLPPRPSRRRACAEKNGWSYEIVEPHFSNKQRPKRYQGYGEVQPASGAGCCSCWRDLQNCWPWAACCDAAVGRGRLPARPSLRCVLPLTGAGPQMHCWPGACRGQFQHQEGGAACGGTAERAGGGGGGEGRETEEVRRTAGKLAQVATIEAARASRAGGCGIDRRKGPVVAISLSSSYICSGCRWAMS